MCTLTEIAVSTGIYEETEPAWGRQPIIKSVAQAR